MQLVTMPKPKSCSVCCIAILTNKTFDDAMKLCFTHSTQDLSMNIDEMEKTLNRAGLRTLQVNTTPDNPTNNLLIECQHKLDKYWHYIVYNAEQHTYLDPIPNPPPIKEYKFFRAIEILN